MKISAKTRFKIEDRAQNLCEYCKLPQEFSSQSFSIEHITPKSKNGGDTFENLALACQACNNSKYNKTEDRDKISGQIVSLYNPRQDVWHKHFAWSSDFLKIVGLNATGRATIETLKLNRERTVRLRKILTEFGKHPPKSNF